LQTIASAHKLVDEIAPKMAGRTSGHVRIEKTRTRRGDNAQLARVSFVDDLSQAPVAVAAKPAVKAAAKPATTVKPATKVAAAKETN